MKKWEIWFVNIALLFPIFSKFDLTSSFRFNLTIGTFNPIKMVNIPKNHKFPKFWFAIIYFKRKNKAHLDYIFQIEEVHFWFTQNYTAPFERKKLWRHCYINTVRCNYDVIKWGRCYIAGIFFGHFHGTGQNSDCSSFMS